MEILTDPKTGISWETYDDTECVAKFGKLASRIFVPIEDAYATHMAEFINPSWKKVLIPGHLFSSDCSDDCMEGRPDFNPEYDWPFDPAWHRDHLEPLFRILKEDGTNKVIVSTPFSANELKQIPPVKSHGLEKTIVCPSDRHSVYVAVYRYTYSIGHTFMFPFDGRWGFSGNHEDIGVLGGEPELIDRFVDYYGGMAALQKSFSVLAEEHLSWGHWKVASCKTIYRDFNWPWPFDSDEQFPRQ